MTSGSAYMRDFNDRREERERRAQEARDQAAAGQRERQANLGAAKAALLAEAAALHEAVTQLRLPASHGEYQAHALYVTASVREVGRYWQVGQDVFLKSGGTLYRGTPLALVGDGFYGGACPIRSAEYDQHRHRQVKIRKAVRLVRQHGLRGAVINVRPLTVSEAQQTPTMSFSSGTGLVMFEGKLTWESSSEGSFCREPLKLSLSWLG